MSAKKYNVTDRKNNICTSVKSARNEKSMTQKRLAENAAVTEQTIINIESERANPSLDLLLRTLEPLGKTLQIVDIPIAKTKK